MLKKILIIFLVIVGVGYASAFVRGYQYQSSKAKDPIIQEEVVSEKQEMIDEEIINDILSNNDVSNEVDNISTNKVDTTNVVVKKKQNNSNVIVKEEDTSNNNISSNTNVEVNTTEKSNPIKEEIKETQNNSSNEKTDVDKANPNDFYYSFHLGITEFNNMDDCLNAFGILNVRNDDPNLLTGTCIDVVNKYGDVLGEYLYIECLSGDCNTYKDLIKDLIKKKFH